MTEIPDAGSVDYTGAARAAVLAAVGAEHDCGCWLAGVLATVAADLGSTHALVADPAALFVSALADEIADRLATRLAPHLAELVEVGAMTGPTVGRPETSRPSREPTRTETAAAYHDGLWSAGRVAEHYDVAVRFVYSTPTSSAASASAAESGRGSASTRTPSRNDGHRSVALCRRPLPLAGAPRPRGHRGAGPSPVSSCSTSIASRDAVRP